MQRVAFLLGAGASYGAGNIQPYPPPLGRDLYNRLKAEKPRWRTDVSPDEDAAFSDWFEDGMALLWERRDVRAQQLLIDMGVYFLQFTPPSDRSDLYSQMIGGLRRLGLLGSCTFATLNYECTLELAASHAGVAVSVSRRAPPRDDQAVVLKPHGSCVFVLPTGITFIDSTMSGSQTYYDGPIEAVLVDQARRIYTEGGSMPPAMSLCSPGKVSPVAPSAIQAIREEWRAAALEAGVIVVVGARPFLADDHVWQPIVASQADVWYVGRPGGADYNEFEDALGGRLTHLECSFEDGLPRVLRRFDILH